MFKNVTYDVILRRMIDRVNEWAQQQGISLDTREGSIIRTALSPAAVEMQQMYIAIDEVLNESFADTETRDFLIRRCKERGITVEPATVAIRQGEFNLDVPIGSRFSLNKLNYVVVEKIKNYVFKMRCETAGNIGNIESGALIPIDYISGLTYAMLTAVLIPGEDEESTEHLRERYFNSLNSQAFGGNIQDYVEKTLAIDGVGSVKVYPVWNGGGTVKVVLLNTQFQEPSEQLIEIVQTSIDPIQNKGAGLGIAPIGHVVTVDGATEEMVHITTNITFQNGWDWEAILPYIHQAIDDYFTTLASEWDKVNWRDSSTATLVVRISQIETRLLSLTGVLDIQNTTLNGLPQNLTVGVDRIPTRGTVKNA